MDKKHEFSCTIGQLKKFIEKHNLPDDTVIMMQRIEDVYFEKHHWEVIKKKGHWYRQFEEVNKKIDTGYFRDKELFPDLAEDSWVHKKYTEDDLENSLCEYYTCHSPVFYDNEFLYLDAHY